MAPVNRLFQGFAGGSCERSTPSAGGRPAGRLRHPTFHPKRTTGQHPRPGGACGSKEGASVLTRPEYPQNAHVTRCRVAAGIRVHPIQNTVAAIAGQLARTWMFTRRMRTRVRTQLISRQPNRGQPPSCRRSRARLHQPCANHGDIGDGPGGVDQSARHIQRRGRGIGNSCSVPKLSIQAWTSAESTKRPASISVSASAIRSASHAMRRRLAASVSAEGVRPVAGSIVFMAASCLIVGLAASFFITR